MLLIIGHVMNKSFVYVYVFAYFMALFLVIMLFDFDLSFFLASNCEALIPDHDRCQVEM
jgi:hypothetical protein